MASTESLPAPLPLQIISYLPDLKSLDALRRASPLFAEVFRLHAVEVFEHLIRKSLHSEVAIELRAYVLVNTRARAGAQKPETEEELDALYADAKEPLPRTTSFSIVGRTLREFTNSACICNNIFHAKLERLYSLPHEHFADKAMRHWTRVTNPSKVKKPWGSPYTISPSEASPPQWDEEQRMLLAFWRLLLFRVLDQPKTFPAFRQSVRDATPYVPDAIEEMASSVVDYSPLTVWGELAVLPPASSDYDETARLNQETSKYLIDCVTRRNYGYAFFHAACLNYPYSPLKKADWTIFRRLGLGIWSQRRLIELELRAKRTPPVSHQLARAEANAYNHLNSDDLMFTWNVLYVGALASESLTGTEAANMQEENKS